MILFRLKYHGHLPGGEVDEFSATVFRGTKKEAVLEGKEVLAVGAQRHVEWATRPRVDKVQTGRGKEGWLAALNGSFVAVEQVW